MREDILLDASETATLVTSQVKTAEDAGLQVAIDLTNDILSASAPDPWVRPSIGTYGLSTNRIPVAASVLDVGDHRVTHIRQG
jgi:hypothetical protein